MNCIKQACLHKTSALRQRVGCGIGYDWAPRSLRVELPVVYHIGLDCEFEYWASFHGSSPCELRRDTESIIRTCHQAALVDFKAVGNHPEVYELGVGSLRVYYTVESNAVVVRGYSPNLPPHQLDEDFAGGVYSEVDW